MTQSRKPVAMKSAVLKPAALAIGATLAGGLMLSGSAFASTPLAQGYLLGAQQAATTEKATEASSGTNKMKEGSCGAGHKAGAEGKCGMTAMDTDKDGKVSRAEFTAAHGDKFDKLDTSKDGFIDADEVKAHHAEGACGADMKAGDHGTTGTKTTEGKCGEGKCGEGKCGSSK